MRGCHQFSFCIPIELLLYAFSTVINHAKNTFVFVGIVHKKPQFPGSHERHKGIREKSRKCQKNYVGAPGGGGGGGGGYSGIFWVGMCRPGLQIWTPF